MYEVIIKRTAIVKKICGNDWVKVGQVEKTRNASSLFSNTDEPKTYLSDEYGYSPEIEKNVSEETEIYRQKIEEMDLAGVIKAINGL